MAQASISYAALLAASSLLLVLPASAQKAGDTRCNTKGQREVYQCAGSGKLETCKWSVSVGKTCTSVGAAPSSIVKPVTSPAPQLDPKKTGAQAAKDSVQDTRRDGPISASVDKGKAREDALRAAAPTSDSATASDGLARMRDSTSGASKVDLGTDKTNRPATDQGFGTKPDLSGASVGGNPLSRMTQGGGITGPLADAASRGSGTTGIAAQGRGAVSYDPKLLTSDAFKASQLSDPGTSSNVIGYDFDDRAQTWDFKDGSRYVRHNDSIREDIGTRTGNSTTTTTMLMEKVRAVRTETDNGDGTKTIKTEHYDGNGNKTDETTDTGPVTPPADASQPSAGIPVDQNAGFRRPLTSTEIDQLRQAQSGRTGGDIDPNETEESFRVDAGVSAPDTDQIKTGLIGNPGNAAGSVRAVSPTGPNPFTRPNSGGAIDPTDDTVITTGGITEDPADALGGVSPSPNLQAGRKIEEDEEDETDEE